MSASEAAPAKVNLFLHVVGRRADGYHLLDSLVAFAGVVDRIEAKRASTHSLQVFGPGAPALREDPAENLVLRAARLLAVSRGSRVAARLTLTKHLPVAAGIGGGSADAAATLRLLSRMWDARPSPADLSRLAAELGADVPVCLESRPARMGGVGELLAPAPVMPEFGLLLVNPGVPVSTPAVFRARAAGFSPPAELPPAWGDARAMAADLARLGNDLQEPAIRLCPPIAAALERLAAFPGCLLARMSGSGATCFGLFDDPAAAARAARGTRWPPGWWVWGGAPHGVAPDVEGPRAAAYAGNGWGVAKR